jgi:hypothetical protein
MFVQPGFEGRGPGGDALTTRTPGVRMSVEITGKERRKGRIRNEILGNTVSTWLADAQRVAGRVLDFLWQKLPGMGFDVACYVHGCSRRSQARVV